MALRDTVRIELDRPDRTYRSGERIRGSIVIETSRGDRCRTVHLAHYWRTHGRGNADRGERKAALLHEGPLPGTSPHRVAFELVAPGGPFTYHGTLLNVDHYLEVFTDIAGVPGTGSPEEFILVPGSLVDPPRPELFRLTGTKARGAGGCRVILGALLVLFGFFALPVGLVLVIPGLFLLFPALRRGLAGAKLGEVTARLAEPVVEPGEALRVGVRVKPTKPRQINAASAVLRGREICISGKGSDRRVHVQEIHRKEIELSGPRSLAAGQNATLEADIPIPDEAAWTFSSKDNEVTWDVTLYVDIPTWPDWVEEHRIVVWASRPAATGEVAELEPGREAVARLLTAAMDRASAATGDEAELKAGREAVARLLSAARDRAAGAPGETPATEEPAASVRQPPAPLREAPHPQDETTRPPQEPEPLPEEPVAPQPAVPPAPPTSAAPPETAREEPRVEVPETPAPVPPPPPPPPADVGPASREPAPTPGGPAPTPPEELPELAARVKEILAEKSFGGARIPLIRALTGRRFTFDLEVALVQHTFGAGPDPTYRHGRTVKGTVAGTEVEVEVRFPEARNEELDRARPSSVLEVTATVADWEKLAGKPVLEG